MNRRRFLAAIAAIPAAAIAGVRSTLTFAGIKPRYSVLPMLRAYDRAAIAKLFGVPSHLLVEKSTYGSAAEELARMWFENRFSPWTERIKLYRTDPRGLTDEQRETEEATDHPFSKIINTSPEEWKAQYQNEWIPIEDSERENECRSDPKTENDIRPTGPRSAAGSSIEPATVARDRRSIRDAAPRTASPTPKPDRK